MYSFFIAIMILYHWLLFSNLYDFF